MPEGPEVERLRTQLQKTWVGKRIVKFRSPYLNASDPKKYAQDGWSTFVFAVRDAKILSIDRIGKHLWVQYGGFAWQIHLGGTGWFVPHGVNVSNFIHSVSPNTVRVKLVFDRGESWDYHDSRTWGKWWIKPYEAMLEDPFLSL